MSDETRIAGTEAVPTGPPEPFDLVELVATVGDHRVGERGAVIVAGVGRSIVDFAWSDGFDAARESGLRQGRRAPDRSRPPLTA